MNNITKYRNCSKF